LFQDSLTSLKLYFYIFKSNKRISARWTIHYACTAQQSPLQKHLGWPFWTKWGCTMARLQLPPKSRESAELHTSKLYHLGLTNSVTTQWQCIQLQNGYTLSLGRYPVSPWRDTLLVTGVPGKWSTSALNTSGPTHGVICHTHS